MIKLPKAIGTSLFILLFVFPLGFAAAQASPSLGVDQLLSATVPNFMVDGSPMVALHNGSLSATDSNASQYSINLDTASSSYTTGDFLNAGASDIAATITYNGGGSGTFYYLVVFINKNGAPQYLTAIEMGDRITVNQISYSNGIFSANITTQGPNDPMCCGTLRETQQYELKNGTLMALSSPSHAATAPSANDNANNKWFVLAGLIVLILVIGGIVRTVRRRPKKNSNERND